VAKIGEKKKIEGMEGGGGRERERERKRKARERTFAGRPCAVAVQIQAEERVHAVGDLGHMVPPKEHLGDHCARATEARMNKRAGDETREPAQCAKDEQCRE